MFFISYGIVDVSFFSSFVVMGPLISGANKTLDCVAATAADIGIDSIATPYSSQFGSLISTQFETSH